MSVALDERFAPPSLEDQTQDLSLSWQNCQAYWDERLWEELETLKSIFMDDVIIKIVKNRPEIIETVIRPSTGCDVDQQYVSVTLEVRLPERYPDRSPTVFLRNPRGLDDGLLEFLHRKIQQMLIQHVGSVVIYSIVELLRGYLTNCNLPSEHCTICLFGFVSGDAFIKTECYHFFHKQCLSKHLESSQQNYAEELEKLPNWKRMEASPFVQTCPVCRSTITYNVETLKEAPPPIESEKETPFELTAEMKDLQKSMAALLKKQEAKGGVVGSGDNGPRPLTITTAADFPTCPGSARLGNRGNHSGGSFSGGTHYGSNHYGGSHAGGSHSAGSYSGGSGTVMPEMSSMSPPDTSRGAVSRRGGPQNSASRGKNRGNNRVAAAPVGNPFRVPPPVVNPLCGLNRGVIATGNNGRGVISTATPEPVQEPEAPASPSGRPAYRGPYRGFNRRAKPGRRGPNSR